jgi:rhamnulokinase
VAGPTETTVLGNLLSQVRAAGELKSLSEMREIVRGASELQMFEPNAG